MPIVDHEKGSDMKTFFLSSMLSCWAAFSCVSAEASNADDGADLQLLNRIDFTPLLTTSGQPTEADLALVAAAGYDRVVFLAFTNHPTAVAHENDIVRNLGLQFVHIPVEWESPKLSDFNTFSALMQTQGSVRTLVHCEVNFRASVFGFLYQVLYGGADVDTAMSLMHSIWVPNVTWEAFIARVLTDNGVDYQPL